MGALFKVVGFVALMGAGFIELWAMANGLSVYLGIPWLLAAFGTFLIVYIPVIGMSAGAYGLVVVWGWSWMQAIGLVVVPWVLIGIGVAMKDSEE